MNNAIPLIGVIGGRRIPPWVYDEVQVLGGEIIRQGFGLVCGGFSGVMEAACRGASEAKASGADPRLPIIGILTGSRAEEANPYVEVAIPTGMGVARNVMIVQSAVGIIAAGGGSGTLSELAYAWQLGIPVAALGSSGGWAQKLAGQSLDDLRDDAVYAASSPMDAVQYIARLVENERPT